MSFIGSSNGKAWEAGYFLVSDEPITRETMTISALHLQAITNADGTKYVPAGAVIPSNDANAVGILYENIDISNGDAAGSVVTVGTVYEDRLPAAIESAAESAMTGIKVVLNEPSMSRPNYDGGTLSAITVASTEGTGAGKTDVAVSGYTPKTGETYAYKIAASAVPVFYGYTIDSTWTKATFPLDELTATSGQKITVVSVDTYNCVVASGNDTITAKA